MRGAGFRADPKWLTSDSVSLLRGFAVVKGKVRDYFLDNQQLLVFNVPVSEKPSINELSRASGLDIAHVSRIMRGLTEPGIQSAQKLADAMGLSLDEFVSSLPKPVTKQ